MLVNYEDDFKTEEVPLLSKLSLQLNCHVNFDHRERSLRRAGRGEDVARHGGEVSPACGK